MEKKLDGNYTRILWAILNKFWRQHSTKQQLYGYLPRITKIIQVRRTRHAGHCWRRRDELLWTLSHGRSKVGRPVRTYIQQLCADTGCSLEDLLGPVDDREGWRERVMEIRVGSATWWWRWCQNFCPKVRWSVTTNRTLNLMEPWFGFGLVWFGLIAYQTP